MLHLFPGASGITSCDVLLGLFVDLIPNNLHFVVSHSMWPASRCGVVPDLPVHFDDIETSP